MARPLVLSILALQLLSSVSAIGWMYTSHKYDCFNIGPCTGDVDYWIGLGNFAFGAFLVSWVALLVSTVLYSKQASFLRSSVSALTAAVLLPPGILFLAHWLFNLGNHTAQV